jgi:hypothetical protein
MTINWDALWVLRTLDRQVKAKHRHGDIVRAGNRCGAVLMSLYRKPDGGFSRRGALSMTEHNSIRVSPALPEGDMIGTSMCLQCLSYADEWNAA